MNREINHAIYLNEDTKKMLLKLSKHISNKCFCNSIYFRLHVESFKLDIINLACGVIQISNKYSCLEIFDP